jgi:haloalkane dehalogenase
VELLQTPPERFADLEGWTYPVHHLEVELPDLPAVRIAYVDEGPREADPVLCLHGEPTWGYLYRHVLPPLVAAGHRVVVPDLVGFGRSDKPTRVEDHTYARHVAWITGLVDALDLDRVTLVGQDWGGLIGLRVLADRPDRFAGAVVANTGLPTGEQRMPDAWVAFRDWMASAEHVEVSQLVRGGCASPLTDAAAAAYDAPFPDGSFQAGVRALPGLVPTDPDDPGGVANRAAWQMLATREVPVLCAFSDRDPITAGADRPFRERLPGAAGQPHTTLRGGGHFLQEDVGPELAEVTAAWIAAGHR